jgi:hypothetical protein
MHVGSGPGVSGLSAMQVKPFDPRRNVRIVPLARMSTTVAPRATAAGAADRALRIEAASPPCRPLWLQAVPAKTSPAAAAANNIVFLVRVISLPLFRRLHASCGRLVAFGQVEGGEPLGIGGDYRPARLSRASRFGGEPILPAPSVTKLLM